MEKRMRIKYIDEIEYCCKKMKKYYESHDDIKLDSLGDYIIVDGKSINECPFCHTGIEVETSVCHYGGEK